MKLPFVAGEAALGKSGIMGGAPFAFMTNTLVSQWASSGPDKQVPYVRRNMTRRSRQAAHRNESQAFWDHQMATYTYVL